MFKLKILVILCFAQFITGCATYVSMSTENPVNTPSSAPRIILGQDAYYWSDNSDLDVAIIEAWRSTGLFKNIVTTDSSTPPTQGTFIKTSCSSSYRNKSTYLLGIPGLLTLGLIPAAEEYNYKTCDTQFYQNGEFLVASQSKYEYKFLWSSWVAAIMYPQEKFFEEASMTAAAHIVNTDLVALKRAYP